jgi:hypothetical protein
MKHSDHGIIKDERRKSSRLTRSELRPRIELIQNGRRPTRRPAIQSWLMPKRRRASVKRLAIAATRADDICRITIDSRVIRKLRIVLSLVS